MTDVPRPKVDAETVAEAAIWVARLQSDKRGPELQDDFRAWLAISERHRAAFEMASETWELAGGTRAPPPVAQRSHNGRRIMAMALSVSLVVAMVGWMFNRGEPIETGIGEQRSVKLADGSVVTLNTATRLTTYFSDGRRLVRLDKGEASFEVAKDSLRPFVVEVAGAQVVAVGTVFDIRYVERALAVTLAEGKVRVVENQPALAGQASEIDMRPGQQLVQYDGGRSRLLAVNLQNVRAWRRGQVVFANTPLATAVREMNRYSVAPIRINDAGVASLRIGGTFRATDTGQFARAIADIHQLQLGADEGAIVLKASPRPR
nr:FecR domain-containing protein [Sphingomonas sp. Y57]